MATIPIPAVIVGLDDLRLFPRDDDKNGPNGSPVGSDVEDENGNSQQSLQQQAQAAAANAANTNAGNNANQNKHVRPTLYTTVADDPPSFWGCLGKCDFEGCECVYFSGKFGECQNCHHENLFHQTKVRRIDLEKKKAADALKKQKNRRHIVTREEEESKKQEEANKPPEFVNTYPCGVQDCECKRMAQPVGYDPSLLIPKLCKSCKHAEIYHVKQNKDDKKNKGGKSARGNKSAPNTSRSNKGDKSGKKSAKKK